MYHNFVIQLNRTKGRRNERLIRYTVLLQTDVLSALPLYSSRKYVSIDKDILRPKKMYIAEIEETEDHPKLEKKPQEIILEQERHFAAFLLQSKQILKI
ncbi:hypothetical protein AKO1_003157 [Acrasis kona]|uniref:Uncharacterized protein n=1 Tax=Acrasis kona TaxID=1008807 RepID=A0AAW2Z8L5_9EUKA